MTPAVGIVLLKDHTKTNPKIRSFRTNRVPSLIRLGFVL